MNYLYLESIFHKLYAVSDLRCVSCFASLSLLSSSSCSSLSSLRRNDGGVTNVKACQAQGRMYKILFFLVNFYVIT